jgi:hypothetical protein
MRILACSLGLGVKQGWVTGEQVLVSVLGMPILKFVLITICGQNAHYLTFLFEKSYEFSGVVVHPYNSSSQEAGAGGLKVQSQLRFTVRPCLKKKL